jgi:hypothetical protein
MSYLFKRAAVMLFIAISIGLFSSCKKETGTNNACKADMPHIAGSYKLTGLKYKLNTTASEQNFLDLLDDCEKDDVLALHADGTYDYNDIGLVCAPGGSNNGSWSITGNRITTSDSDFPEGIISSFDCKSLVYYVNDIYTAGDKLTFTLTRQ